MKYFDDYDDYVSKIDEIRNNLRHFPNSSERDIIMLLLDENLKLKKEIRKLSNGSDKMELQQEIFRLKGELDKFELFD